ncbi:DUF6292 family protein [Actinoplanes siamensis]|uniref:DUF6292 domain-containing protein n=1 Tax=Actinoplanes siamensis TaxID=1223317 RepID=A0A919N0V3_9ACTN|nr:DUF6292 family protein [Actinoplanes siamensis]GIF03329.1 hypothetical protein Asi03nite_08670 [Actinoplanes siamensis]
MDYLRAVAGALEAAGVPVADWRAEGDEGWIPFDLSRVSVVSWVHDQAGVGWSAASGWYLLLIDSPGRRSVVPLRVPVRATPEEVARAVVPA